MRTDFENMPKNGKLSVVLYAERPAVDLWQWIDEPPYKGWNIIMSDENHDFIDQSEELPKLRGWWEIPEGGK